MNEHFVVKLMRDEIYVCIGEIKHGHDMNQLKVLCDGHYRLMQMINLL